MLTYTLQYPNINTKFYTPRYISPAVRNTNIPVMIPLPELLLGDYGTPEVPEVVTAFWQVLKIRGLDSTWDHLMDFYSSVRERKVLDLHGIADSIKEVVPGNLVSFKKWQDVRLAMSEGHPVMVGGSAYESFLEAEHTGIVQMPTQEEPVIGGFITTLFFLDNESDFIRGLSTTGGSFGKEGTLLLRGSYIRNLLICRDFFTFIPRIF